VDDCFLDVKLSENLGLTQPFIAKASPCHMARLTTRQLFGEFLVDEIEYSWRLERDPRAASGIGIVGAVVEIVAAQGQRSLLLELTNQDDSRNGTPYHRRPKISEAQLMEGVRAALAGGWKPFSRGRPFKYCAPMPGSKTVVD
jgi:hypothetical protein